ncbi:somatic embryogenesis receptor kinase 4 [Artemisia annua]|uniref:Somatic embryogenesis receptor kinase 4 n=1 Tax=Artemisia annua TaxID=35608 RepID=A0A2U1PFQ7_ARTAN|nr:somatic embryogenesis receptor kinase 4 [Artemisia annua]
MPNGSLTSCLKVTARDPLNWPQRKHIALGSARGLAYLHNLHPRNIIHRDVKADNILLTHQFEVVLSDFGCTKDLNFEDSDVTTTNPSKRLHVRSGTTPRKRDHTWAIKETEMEDTMRHAMFRCSKIYDSYASVKTKYILSSEDAREMEVAIVTRTM